MRIKKVTTSPRHHVTKKGLIFVISGPSGSGKTTLRDRLLKDKNIKRFLIKSVSLTCRPRRSGEKEGRDYFFVSQPRFLALRKGKKILEWTRYLGYYYATPKDFVDRELAKGNSIIMCLDLRGEKSLKRAYPAATRSIFILPPSISALKKRIESRGREACSKEIGRRLKIARRELAEAKIYDYTLENINLQQAVKSLRGIILGELHNR